MKSKIINIFMLLFLGVTYNLITVKAFPEGSRLTALILGNVIYLVLLFKIDFNLENLRKRLSKADFFTIFLATNTLVFSLGRNIEMIFFIFLFAGLFFTMSFLLLKKETEEPKN